MYVSLHKACVSVIRVEKTVIWLRTHYIKANIFAVHEYDKSSFRLYYENKGFYISMYYNCNNVPNDYIKSTEYGKRKTTPRIP